MNRLIFAAGISLAFAASTHAVPLTVTIDEVNGDGPLYVSIQSEAEFMQNEGTAGRVIQSPEPGRVQLTFDVPAGLYAVSVWHDINANGVFDRAENGWPLDGWAMSGPVGQDTPQFSDVAVSVPAEGAAVEMSMRYPE